MTELLKKAFAELEALPPERQDTLAQILLDELTSERRWDELLARPIEGTKLEQLLQEAEEDIRAGRTMPVDSLLEEGEPAASNSAGPAEKQR